MKLNEYQLAVVGEKIAAYIDPCFYELEETEQKVSVQHAINWLYPLLAALPEGTTAATLNEHSAFIFSIAEDLLLETTKQTPGYRTLDEDHLRMLLDGQKINQIALNLYKYARHALEVIPDEITLKTIAENFESIDIDVELMKLMEREKGR